MFTKDILIALFITSTGDITSLKVDNLGFLECETIGKKLDIKYNNVSYNGLKLKVTWSCHEVIKEEE